LGNLIEAFKRQHQMSIFKIISATCLVSLLAACGGSTGFPPVITGVKVQTLKYGNTATVYLGGKDLRSSITVESNGGCTNPSFASNSTTDTLVLNCVVKLVGDVPLTFKAEDGSVIYTTTLTVPKPQVTLFTTKGTVVMELDPSTAPISSNNYLSYVSKGFYTSTLFHRVISGFMIQGGGYTTGMVKKTGQAAAIELESNKGLSNLRGTLAMARTDVFNSATSEFFINVVDNTFLDYKTEASPGYAVFGKVVQGMDVVDAIVAQPTGVSNGFADVPLTDVVISLALQTQ
jgi:peptidyl-prolyl cis-trans isomerase A (cyclophilin A)